MVWWRGGFGVRLCGSAVRKAVGEVGAAARWGGSGAKGWPGAGGALRRGRVRVRGGVGEAGAGGGGSAAVGFGKGVDVGHAWWRGGFMTRRGSGSPAAGGGGGGVIESVAGADRPFTVSFEGNIAVGKSTLMAGVGRDRGGTAVGRVGEPVKRWQDVRKASAGYRSVLERMLGFRAPRAARVSGSGSGSRSGGRGARPRKAGRVVNALGRYYASPETMAYPFQSLVLVTRLVDQLKAGEKVVQRGGRHGGVLLVDRSVLSDRNVFVESMRGSGTMRDEEVAIYEAWYEGMLMATAGRVVPDCFVYVRASPWTCMERLKARRRSEEAGIPASLLKSLHAVHERWMLGQTRAVVWGKDGKERRSKAEKAKEAAEDDAGGKQRYGGVAVRRPRGRGGGRKVPAGCQVRRFDRRLGCHPVLHGRPVLVFDARHDLSGGRRGRTSSSVVNQIQRGPFTRFFWAFVNSLRSRVRGKANGLGRARTPTPQALAQSARTRNAARGRARGRARAAAAAAAM